MIKRLKRLVLLLKALIFCVFNGRVDRNAQEPKSILIVQLAKLGDMVCTTPMFRAVKDKYPQAHLTVVGDAINKQILDSSPDIDSYIIWSAKDLSAVQKEIQKRHYDFACIVGPNFDSLAVLILAGVSSIAVPQVMNGWSPYETKPYKILRKFCIVKPHSFGAYAPREYLRLLEPIGIFTEDTKKYLAYSQSAEKRIAEFLEKHGFQKESLLVGITPSAGNKIKKWPEDRFATIADYLIEKYGAKVIVVAGPMDVEESKAMFEQIRNKDNVINATEKLSIDDLKALISRLNLFIGVDTGPVYIAESFGIPTIDIVGPMDENEQPPKGHKHIVVVPANRVKPELHIMNARIYNEAEAIRQVLSITTDQVIQAVDKLASFWIKPQR